MCHFICTLPAGAGAVVLDEALLVKVFITILAASQLGLAVVGAATGAGDAVGSAFRTTHGFLF
jgi:hypothetical protein